jgi:hypothetical protein
MVNTGLNDLDCNGWVDAVPFRALCHYLMAQTGLPWYAIPAATRTPHRMIRTLLFDTSVRRIRYIDAKQLLYTTSTMLLSDAAALVDVSRCAARLSHLGEPVSVTDLVTHAGIDVHWATGLVEGWLVRCPRHVVWRLLGYIEIREAALNKPPTPQPPKSPGLSGSHH